MKFTKSSFLLLLLSILLIAYTFYKSEIIHGGLNRDYYIQYYLLSFFIVLLAFVFQIFDYKFKKSSIILVSIIIIFLYIIELALIYKNTNNEFNSQNNLKSYIKEEKYLNLKNNNDDIVTYIEPRNFINDNTLEVFPLSGIPNTQTIFCEEDGRLPIYISDRYGFRNPDILWDQKNNIDIMLIGESYFSGACVSDGKTITANLRNLLKDKKIVNLSYLGNGPLIQFATLIEYLNVLNPKIILWAYREKRDLLYLSYEKRNKILNNYISNKNFFQDITSKQALVNITLRKKFKDNLSVYDDKIINFDFIKFIKFSELRNYIQPIKSNPTYSEYELFYKIIKKSYELTNNKNIKFYVVYFPDPNLFISDRAIIEDSNSEKNIIINNLNKIGVEIIDIKKNINNHSDPSSLYGSNFNEKGYLYISEIISQYLRQKK